WLDLGQRVFAAYFAADDSDISRADGEATGGFLEEASRGFADFGDSAFQPGDCRGLGEGLSGAAVCDDYYGFGGLSATIVDWASEESGCDWRDGRSARRGGRVW